jgi:hypothetical protein
MLTKQKRRNDMQLPYTEVYFELKDGVRFNAKDKEMYQSLKHLFSWLDPEKTRILINRLTGQTESDHKSVLVIHEEGQITKYTNLPLDWRFN